LDTNALIWFLAGEPLEEGALIAIARAQAARALYVSPITAWEAALAIRKRDPDTRPNLRGQDAATWFRDGRKEIGARLALIGTRIALEASRVPAVFGYGDPGDCYIIATARVKSLTIVTRDRAIVDLGTARPTYVRVITC
jgi:PIN domain nuclease of toxin-antitoxin system